ncbi:MAG: oligosaccharide flippase family protein [Mogibacterium sp.]|nr:oligosaccharide flippase family protein [Mogibacterium sp.]
MGNFLLKGMTFLTLPIFARILTKADYGQYSIFATYETMLFVIIGFAIHSSYKNAYYKFQHEGSSDRSEYNSYVTSTFILILLSTCVWFVLSVVFSKPLSRLLGLDTKCLPLLVLFSAASAIITCFNTDVGIRYEYGKFLAVSFFNAISSIILSIVLIFTVFNDERYMGRIVGCTAPYVFVAAFLFLSYFSKARPQKSTKPIKWGLRYSLPIIPHGLSQIVLNQFDRIMIMHMINSAVAGVYSFAYNVYMIITVTATSIDNVWSPWFFERRNEDNFKAIKRVSSYYMLLLLAMCVLVALASPELILILGGAKYKEAVYCVIPIVTSGFFAFSYNIPAAVEYYNEKTGGIALATAFAAVINIVLNYFFILKYGYVAAAYTTLVTYILYYTVHMILAYRIEGRMLFDVRTVLLASVAVIANNFLSLRLVDHALIRYAAILCIGSVVLMLEEKHFGIIRKRIRK